MKRHENLLRTTNDKKNPWSQLGARLSNINNMKECSPAHPDHRETQDNPAKKRHKSSEHGAVWTWDVLTKLVSTYLETMTTCSAVSWDTIFSLYTIKDKQLQMHPNTQTRTKTLLTAQIIWRMGHICVSHTHSIPRHASVSRSSFDSSWPFGSLRDERRKHVTPNVGFVKTMCAFSMSTGP